MSKSTTTGSSSSDSEEMPRVSSSASSPCASDLLDSVLMIHGESCKPKPLSMHLATLPGHQSLPEGGVSAGAGRKHAGDSAPAGTRKGRFEWMQSVPAGAGRRV